jgi:hypothetical protein
MDERSSQLLDRIGAAAGLAAVLLLVALFTVFPSLPSPDSSIRAIAAKANANRDGLLLGGYAGALMTGALTLFGASLAARLRRAEGSAGGGWWLVALAGIAGTAIGIVGNALEIMFVRAVGHGAGGTSLWIGYGADHWLGVLVAIPLALFLLGVGLGARATATLPRWLAWLALVLSPLFLLGAGSVTGDEVDGGILGVPLLVGYLGLIVWIVATSITILRRPQPAIAEQATARLATE